MTLDLWTRTKQGGWKLSVDAEGLAKVLKALGGDPPEAAVHDINSPPQAILEQAKKLLQRLPREYIDKVAAYCFLPDDLIECEDDLLARGSLTAAYVRGLDGDQLEALAQEMHSRIRLTRMTLEFRPEDSPVGDGSLVDDTGYVLDPLHRLWLASVAGNYIEGWFEPAT